MEVRRRGFVVPAVLLLAAVALAWLAVQAGKDGPVAVAAPTTKPLATPVLSARRFAPYLVAPIANGRLDTELDQVVAQSPTNTCLTVSVAGRVVYSHNPDLPVTPASNEKLVTATAALDLLGPNDRFTTKVVAAAKPIGGTVAGDVYLVGGGDPVLDTKPYAAHYQNQPQIFTPLESLADALRAAGVTHIQGRIVGDESRYDSQRYPSTWPVRYAQQAQSGPLSALSVNDGFSAWPQHQTQEGTTESTPASDPVMTAIDAFRTLLTQRGITVDGGDAAGTAPAADVKLAAIQSPPLEKIVSELLTESDNHTAEMLVKELGYRDGGAGTTVAGVKVVTATMLRLGLARPGTGAFDGSGLDENDKTTCRLLMGVLDHSGPNSVMGRSLAVAGQTGTLATRFLQSPAKKRLRAKTGTLNTVTALTGFVDALQGPVLTFAYVANGEYVNAALLKLQETMGDDMVIYPQGPSLTAVSPQK